VGGWWRAVELHNANFRSGPRPGPGGVLGEPVKERGPGPGRGVVYAVAFGTSQLRRLAARSVPPRVPLSAKLGGLAQVTG
jgi:hypothetical protein